MQLFSRSRAAPSWYPRVIFHAIRGLQLLSSLIVGGIMSYFTYHLKHDGYHEPWTFIWLMSASLASIAALTFTIIRHFTTGLNPRLNIALNSGLAVLWGLSWSLLTWYMSGTLANFCDIEHWNEDVGMMICRIYKALFTFTLLGLLSTLAALALDIYVRRQQTRRGAYQDIDLKSRPQTTRGTFTEEAKYHSPGDIDAPRESEAWEEPRSSIGPYMERMDALKEAKGYSVPEDQFGYNTGYHGGHSERPF